MFIIVPFCRCLTLTNDYRDRLHVALLPVGECALGGQQLFEFGGLNYLLFIFLLSLVQYDNTIMSFMNYQSSKGLFPSAEITPSQFDN